VAALEFAQGADCIRDPRELNRRFGQVVRPFGVKYFSTIEMATPGQIVMPRVLAGEVDPQWTEHYARQNFAAVDPVLGMLFATRKPFTWREAAVRATTEKGRRLFDEVKEITGVDDALVIPIHDRAGSTAAVILSGDRAEFGPDVRPVLHLAAVYFSGVAYDLENAAKPEEDCPLTARQLECLRWAMDGKSDWAMGEILGISERTAHNHIEAAKRALDVGTRTQAFVTAWRRGWLV
jgi:LuxR family quorum sensing-dependent transcriptional regulator